MLYNGDINSKSDNFPGFEFLAAMSPGLAGGGEGGGTLASNIRPDAIRSVVPIIYTRSDMIAGRPTKVFDL